MDDSVAKTVEGGDPEHLCLAACQKPYTFEFGEEYPHFCTLKTESK